jgi:uncharacterized protein
MLGGMRVAAVLLLLAAAPSLAADQYPAHTGYVVDAARILDADAVASIRETASRLDQAGIAQLAVLTVPDLGDQSPEEYAVAVFKKWGLGHQHGSRDDGVLILMVPGGPGHRRTKVETGSDIEGILPDGKLGAIYDRVARPFILRNDYGGAARALVEAIAAELERDAAANGTSRPTGLLRRASRGSAAAGVGGLALAVVCMVGVLIALVSSGARRRFPGRKTGLAAAGLTAVSVLGLLFLGGAAGWIALLVGLVANGFAYASIRSHKCSRPTGAAGSPTSSRRARTRAADTAASTTRSFPASSGPSTSAATASAAAEAASRAAAGSAAPTETHRFCISWPAGAAGGSGIESSGQSPATRFSSLASGAGSFTPRPFASR